MIKKIIKIIIKENLNYEQTVKLLDQNWTTASESEQKELIALYCKISGSNSADLLEHKKKQELTVKRGEYKQVDFTLTSTRLEWLENRIENARKNIKEIINKK